MNDYIRKVHYHETDKMGVTHHSNYVKWMEEARVDYLDQLGCGYALWEANGIISPVVSIECQYKRSTTFADEIRIQARIEEFKGVKLKIRYVMTNNATGEVVLTARSSHCFLDGNGNPVILKKTHPEFDKILKEHVEPAE